LAAKARCATGRGCRRSGRERSHQSSRRSRRRQVYVADDDGLSRYTTAAYSALLVDAIRTYNPIVVLVPSTSNGRDLAPRVAARLAVGLTADCIDLDISEHGSLIQYKPAFGGNIVALIYSRLLPQIATVKPGMLRAVAPNGRAPRVIHLAVPRNEISAPD